MMDAFRYCTPEWLEESTRLYPTVPRFQHEFAKLSMSVCFQVNAEPAWGLDETIYFMASVDRGKLDRLSFLSAAEAHQAADFVLAASPQEWKKILRKESKFVTDFMLGKILLVKGSKVAVLSLAPHSTTFVETLTQAALQFPDEMTPDELDCYREDVRTFRHALGV
jgi:putative sterol carrier protein